MTEALTQFTAAFCAALAMAPLFITTDLLYYFSTAGGLFVLLYVWRHHPWRAYRIQPKARQGFEQYRREIFASLITILVFAAATIATVTARKMGYTLVYFDRNDYAAWYFPLSLVLLFIMHDAWFYWTHRLLHWKPLFRSVHRHHHISTAPSPWTAYAFHPVEALVNAIFLTIAVFILPLHISAIAVFMILQILRNAIGHCGYELFPRWFAESRFGSLFTTCTHHDLHHHYFHKNFGLYFTWWDRWMGTEDEEYMDAYRRARGAKS